MVLFICFGLISSYSFELGFGFIVVSCLWPYSWGLIASTLVCFCRQYADIRSMHVICVEEGVVFFTVVYEVLSELSRLFLTCVSDSYGLRLGLFDSFGLFSTISMYPISFLGLCVVFLLLELWEISQVVTPMICNLSVIE